MAGLTETLPAKVKLADIRLPGNDPLVQWDKLTKALAVTRPQRYQRAADYRDLILKRIRVG
jgi:hypothetical protein